MHRTEAENNSSNRYTDGPPGTRISANSLNSIQEELAAAIEGASLTLQTAISDDYSQLKSAIEILGQAAAGMPSGTKTWFYQNTAPTGWTVDSTPADAVLAVKGGSQAYNANGGTQAGTWTQPNHQHDLASGAGNGAFPNHQHAVGTIAFPNHQHGQSLTTPVHSHTGTHTHNLSGGVATASNPAHIHRTQKSAVDTTTTDTGDFVGVPNNAGNSNVITYDPASGSTTNYQIKDYTETDGATSLTGITAATQDATDSGNGASIGGTVDNDAGAGCTGDTASDAGTAITGHTDNDATAITYRPLAQLGIICTKD